MLARSTFHWTATRQLIAGLRSSAWVRTGEVCSLVASWGEGLIATQVVEDSFGVMKNATQLRGSKRWRKPQKAMGVAIGRKVIDGRHRFKAIVPNVPLGRRTVRLKRSSFQQGKRSPSLCLAGIATTESKAKYHSPSPSDTGVAVADLAVMRLARETRTIDQVCVAKLGCFCSASHGIIFKRDADGAASIGWHLALCHYAGSGFLAWPVQLHEVPTCPNSRFAALQTDIGMPHVFAASTWRGITAARCEWRPWSWQCAEFPRASSELRPALRLFLTSPEEPLVRVAARSAWWSLDLSILRTIAADQGFGLGPGLDLFETCLAMVRLALGINDEAALAILSQRMAQPSEPTELVQELLQIDEAVQVLDRNDVQSLRREQQSARDAEVQRRSFADQFRAKRAEVKAAANPSRKRKASAKADPARPRRLPAQLSELAQSEYKRYLPEGAFLWKSNFNGSWNARLPPFGQVSRSWSKHGEFEALRLVLAGVWYQWCDVNGIEHSACPMEGLGSA